MRLIDIDEMKDWLNSQDLHGYTQPAQVLVQTIQGAVLDLLEDYYKTLSKESSTLQTHALDKTPDF